VDPRIQELLTRLAEVDDFQLGDLEDILVAQLEGAAEAKDVEVARNLAEAIDKVRAERTQRAELARQREHEIAEIMSRVHAQNEDEGEEEEAEKTGSEGSAAEGSDDGSGNESDAEEGVTHASRKDRPLPPVSLVLQPSAGVRHRIRAGAERRRPDPALSRPARGHRRSHRGEAVRGRPQPAESPVFRLAGNHQAALGDRELV